MSRTFFTADLHLGHRLVSGLRGYDDPAEHDAVIADHWKTAVGGDDIVWVLGDLAVVSSRRGIDELLAKVDALPGTKHLIAGNHDPVHPMHRDAHRWQRRYLEVFESVQAFSRRTIGLSLPGEESAAQTVFLSHFPYMADHTEGARYLEYRLRDEGHWLLHGHTHSSERVTSPREIHVGLDAWDLRPVELGAIARLMADHLRATGDSVSKPSEPGAFRA